MDRKWHAGLTSNVLRLIKLAIYVLHVLPIETFLQSGRYISNVITVTYACKNLYDYLHDHLKKTSVSGKKA